MIIIQLIIWYLINDTDDMQLIKTRDIYLVNHDEIQIINRMEHLANLS